MCANKITIRFIEIIMSMEALETTNKHLIKLLV
jgi:hypothetical protein